MPSLAVALLLALPAQAETEYESLRTRLLKEHPEDPAVLMLCLDRRDLGGQRRLAALQPTPATLSYVLNAFLNPDDRESRQEARRLAVDWDKQDPENGYPPLVLGCLHAADGDLPQALTFLDAASRRKTFRTYAIESRLAIREMLRKREITDIMAIWINGGLQRSEFEVRLLQAYRILHSCAEEELYRRRRDEAERLFVILARIGRLLIQDPDSDSYGAAPILLEEAAGRLVEIALSKRRPDDAARWADLARTARRTRESLTRAALTFHNGGPMAKLASDIMDLQMKNLGPLLAWKNDEARKAHDRQVEALVRANEKHVRGDLDAWLPMGECRRILQHLSEKDRLAAAGLKVPIDAVLEAGEGLYPAVYRPADRDRLVRLVNAPAPEENREGAQLLADAALRALLHAQDKEAAGALEGNAYAQASLGLADPKVIDELKKALDDGTDYPSFRPLARLGRKECAAGLLKCLRDAVKERHYEAALAAAYALRDLTGKDFSLDVGKWEAAAREQPDLFPR